MIDEDAAGNLSEQADYAADGENETDIGLRPFLAGQIDGDEGTEAGLNVGDAKDEPVQAAQAFPRWSRSRRWRKRRRTGLTRLRPGRAFRRR